MKTTLKEYKQNVKNKGNAVCGNYEIERKISFCDNQETKVHYYKAVEVNKEIIKLLTESYFNLLDTVNVSFYIGCRSYYREVVKIGKFYYDRGEKLTKGNGYRSVKEIEETTEKMTESMISDSYYY